MQGGAREIILAGGAPCIVDDADFEWLSQYRWCGSGNLSHRYAVSRIGGRIVKMHRLILDAPADLMVDHINHHTLDNRRANLRLCTRAQNFWNRGPAPNNTSGFKGVQRSHRRGVWIAKIQANGRGFTRHASTAEEAARHYDELAREHHGEFAALNFPPEAA